MPDVTLEYRVPADDLQPYVTLFYHFRADVPVFEDTERADHAQLRFRLSEGASHYVCAGGRPQNAPPCHVIGPTSVAIRTFAEGPVEVVGMGLQPAGWAALFGTDASAFVDRVAEMDALLGHPDCGAERARLAAADGSDAKIAVVADFVRRAIARRDEETVNFARTIDAWLASTRSPDVATLIERCGLSRRQVERRTKALYGIPPKMLARKYRALRTAVALAAGEGTADALEGGAFYDQSHLIRELKQFTGLTPRQMQAAPGLLAQLTIQQRRALEGKVHPIISGT